MRKVKSQHREQAKAPDFYVKTQCEKKYGEEGRKSTIIVKYKNYKNSLSRA